MHHKNSVTSRMKRFFNTIMGKEKKMAKEDVVDECLIHHLNTTIDITYERPIKQKKFKQLIDSMEHKKELIAYHYPNATILPGSNGKGGVIDFDHTFIEESATLWFGGEYIIENYDETPYEDSKVVYLGAYMDDCFGHIFVSMLIRFWYVFKNDTTVDKYIISSRTKGQKYQHAAINSFIELFGIKDKVEFINEPTRYKEVILPEASFRGRGEDYYSDEFIRVIEVIVKNALANKIESDNTSKRIFLSRSRFAKAKNNEGGLELLDHFFEKNGFKILYPEELSILEMIHIMQNAEICACESGSISFNGLFANEKMELVIIDRIAIYADALKAINLSKAKKITYVDASYTLYPMHAGGGCILAYTKEYDLFTKYNNLKKPDNYYVSKKYLTFCYEVYMKRYRQKQYQKQELIQKKEWLPVVYEAYQASLEVFDWISKEDIEKEFVLLQEECNMDIE